MLFALSGPAGAQDGNEGGGQGGGNGDRSDNVAAGIDRVGNLGVGIVDNNPGRDVTGGGIPCSLNDSCGAPTGTPNNGPAAADSPAPPPPPTHGEIVQAVCPTPATTIGHNPRQYGITGFDTWLWSTGPTSYELSGAIRGYPVTCTLTATRFDFDTGDTHATRFGHNRHHTTTDPGGEHADTPVQHLYEVKGTYTLALTIRWHRATTAGQDTTTSTTTRDYQVKEVVAGTTSG